jgi:hypothetical protein
VHHHVPTPSRPWRRCAQISAAALAGALVLSTTACGRGTEAEQAAGHQLDAGSVASPTTTGGALDPCSIIPAARLAELIDAELTQHGPAVDRALGQECTWDFPDPRGLGTGSVSITAWHGPQFFLAGSIGEPLRGVGDEAQSDPTLGIVLLRVGDEVVQAHVLSPDKRALAPRIASALADAI